MPRPSDYTILHYEFILRIYSKRHYYNNMLAAIRQNNSHLAEQGQKDLYHDLVAPPSRNHKGLLRNENIDPRANQARADKATEH